MANRGDFYKVALPRRFQRMLSLMSSGDPHQDGIVRRLFIGAVKHAQTHDRAIIGAREQVDTSEQEALAKAAKAAVLKKQE